MMNFETRLIKRASVWLFHAISLILIDERQSKHKSASLIKSEIRITVQVVNFEKVFCISYLVLEQKEED